MFGLPPKESFVLYTIRNVEENRLVITDWLKNHQFEITDESRYTLSAVKKCKRTFLSMFSLGRPQVSWHILITEEGRITINSRYDYDSMFGIPFSDKGRQKHLLTLLNIYLKP